MVIRDITDISHPKTVGNLGLISLGAFVSATVLSYIDETGLIRTPLAGTPKTVVAASSQMLGADSFAWSPDGNTVVYLTQGSSGMALHQLSAGQDRVFGGTMPALPAVGCESQFCATTDTWDFRLSYSPDGTHISLMENVIHPVFRLWTSDGTLLNTIDSQLRSMSVWSGTSLYFLDAKGVEVWRAGVISPFLPGVAWIRPKASPAGGQIVYEIRDAQGWAHTYIVSTISGTVRELNKGRAEPVFLTSRYLWYQGERACIAADACPTGYTVIASGKTYIYDLLDGTETESVITRVADIWPHAA